MLIRLHDLRDPSRSVAGMEGIATTLSGLLDWSRSAFGRWHGLGPMDEGCLRIGGGRDFRMGSESWFTLLSVDW